MPTSRKAVTPEPTRLVADGHRLVVYMSLDLLDRLKAEAFKRSMGQRGAVSLGGLVRDILEEELTDEQGGESPPPRRNQGEARDTRLTPVRAAHAEPAGTSARQRKLVAGRGQSRRLFPWKIASAAREARVSRRQPSGRAPLPATLAAPQRASSH